jgi:hypothetical protein
MGSNLPSGTSRSPHDRQYASTYDLSELIDAFTATKCHSPVGGHLLGHIHTDGAESCDSSKNISVDVSDSSGRQLNSRLSRGKTLRYLAVPALLISATTLGCGTDDLQALPRPQGAAHTCSP